MLSGITRGAYIAPDLATTRHKGDEVSSVSARSRRNSHCVERGRIRRPQTPGSEALVGDTGNVWDIEGICANTTVTVCSQCREVTE